MTFALYLFHLPLLFLLDTYPPGAPTSLIQRIWAVGGTLLLIFALGPVLENSEGCYKRWLLAAIGRVTGERRRRVVPYELLRRLPRPQTRAAFVGVGLIAWSKDCSSLTPASCAWRVSGVIFGLSKA